MPNSALAVEDVANIRFVFADMYGITLDPEKEEKLVEWWFDLLRDYPREVVKQASMNVLKRVKYKPTVADICQEIERMTKPLEKSDEELWEELSDTFYRVNHNAAGDHYTAFGEGARCMAANEAIYEKLSPEIKLYVRSVAALIHIAALTPEQRNYEKSQFLRRIRPLREQKKTLESMPSELRAMLESYVNGKIAEGDKARIEGETADSGKYLNSGTNSGNGHSDNYDDYDDYGDEDEDDWY